MTTIAQPFQQLDEKIFLELISSIQALQAKAVVNTAKEYLDVSEACQFLCVSKSTLYKLNHRKELRYYKTGKKVFYARDSLIEYITRNKILSKDDIESQAYYQAKRLRNRL